MKRSLQKVVLIIAVTCSQVEIAFSESVVERISAMISHAAMSGEVPAVAKALFSAEELWLDSPEGYFQIIGQAEKVFANLADETISEQCLSYLFESISEKRRPAKNTQQDAMYFEQKGKIYLTLLNSEKNRKEKSRLLSIAQFIGEIRTNMIPDYQNQGTSYPGLDILNQSGVSNVSALTDSSQIEAYNEAVKENAESLLVNELQSTLQRYDKIMTFHLIHLCAQLVDSDSSLVEFINDIVRNAQLSKNEVMLLVGDMAHF